MKYDDCWDNHKEEVICSFCKRSFLMSKDTGGRYIGNKAVCGYCSEDNSILLDCVKIK
jgi:hypothetical protein